MKKLLIAAAATLLTSLAVTPAVHAAPPDAEHANIGLGFHNSDAPIGLRWWLTGQKIGIDLGMTIDERFAVTRKLGAFKTSMLQDLEAGKPLEVDGLLAGTLEIARKAGVRAPLTESLFGLIRVRAVSSGQYQPTA